MTPETFFANFGHLADAPNGVQKLRELILSLAVRGKLVPQDPSDEPASVLLAKIKAERERLVKEKKIRKAEPLPPVRADESPYELPQGWEWVRLDEVFYPISTSGNKVNTSQMMNIGKFPVVDQGQSYIAGYIDDAEKVISIPGPVIVFGDHTKALKYIDFDFVAGADGVKILRPLHMHEPYFFRALKSYNLDDRGYGRHYKILMSNLFPLPPLAEQHRIVAKVDQLMALCDELEERQQRSRAKLTRLNNAALDRLLNAREAEACTAAWRLVRDNFDLLYTTPETIAKLRQAILQLAVQGKLVPQDPNDEPASVLLTRIKAEKERLVKEKKIRKAEPLPPVSADEAPYKLPKGWEWVRLGEVKRVIEYGTSQRAHEYPTGVPILRMNNIVEGKVVLDNLKYVESTIAELPKLYLKNNDLLFNRTNSYELVGKTGLFRDSDDKYTFASYLIRIALFQDHLDASYINLSMNSEYFRKTQIEPEITQQCGQANFNGTKLGLSLIPLAPLAEQHRIVAKVDQLMTLCDELETKLTKSQTKADKLAAAAVKGLVAA